VEGFCEHGNELPGSLNAGKFLKSSTTGGFLRRLSSMKLVKMELLEIKACV
jgi:hypothetical protein